MLMNMTYQALGWLAGALGWLAGALVWLTGALGWLDGALGWLVGALGWLAGALDWLAHDLEAPVDVQRVEEEAPAHLDHRKYIIQSYVQHPI